MAEKGNIIEATGFFDGYKTKGNFDVEISFKFPEEQLANALQLVTGIGSHLKIVAIIDGKKVKLGTFSLYRLSVDRDANTKLTLKTNIDMCFLTNFERIIDDETPIVLKAMVTN